MYAVCVLLDYIIICIKHLLIYGRHVIRQAIYIFILSFVLLLLLLSFFPRLISAVGDWMSAILPHMVWP